MYTFDVNICYVLNLRKIRKLNLNLAYNWYFYKYYDLKIKLFTKNL